MERKNTTKIEELLEIVRQRGEQYDPQTFQKKTKQFLRRITPQIKAEKTEVPGFAESERIIRKYISKIDNLNADELIDLGGRICNLEYNITRNDKLLEGLGIVAVGRALVLDPESVMVYATIAEITKLTSPELPKNIPEELYKKALIYVQLDRN